MANRSTGQARGVRQSKDRLIAAALIGAIVLIVGLLGGMFLFQSSIRQFRNQIRFFDPSWMCVAEYQDTTVVLESENQRKLLNVLERCRRKFVMDEPAATDTVSFTFKKDGVKWDMDISRTDQACLKLDLTGEKEYHIYIPEDNYYETIVELASPGGGGTPNKALAAVSGK